MVLCAKWHERRELKKNMAEPKAVSLPKSRTTTPKNKAITPKNGVTPRNMFSPKLAAPNDVCNITLILNI